MLVPRKSQQRRRRAGEDDGRSVVCDDSINFCARRSAATISLMSSSRNNGNDASIIDKISRALGIARSLEEYSPLPSNSDAKEDDPSKSQGRVVRTAARPRQSSGGSIPSSPRYTTRKPSLPFVVVSEGGVSGDYNHYRTAALQSTTDRAISILTGDVGSYVRSLDGVPFSEEIGKGYRDGDLGENVLVEGVDFGFFRVGERYRFSPASSRKGGGDVDGVTTTNASAEEEDVIVEITEPMEPCANLCKLPFINDPSLSVMPKERLARCRFFIEALGRQDGLRGWYAKVVQGGVVRVGDSLSLLALGS